MTMWQLNMQRCLSGLRSTIGNRVWVEAHRRFKSCSLRQEFKGFQRFCRNPFFVHFYGYTIFGVYVKCCGIEPTFSATGQKEKVFRYTKKRS